jgi:thiol-disulfide isomerase/thioredoxin
VAVGLLYIIGAHLIKPVARAAEGPAGSAINTGPASVSEAAPGTLHVIPALGAAGSGLTAPDTKFLEGEGQPVTLSKFRGKVVLLNLWATWCTPCKVEMPALARLQAAYAGKDLQVVALSIDNAKAEAKARAFIAQNAPLALYRDPDYALPPSFSPPVLGVPATFFIDRSGRVRGRVDSDADWTGPKARAAVDQLLAE